MGIINGNGDGTFSPEDNVTYEQAVAMVVRAIGGAEAANELGGYPNGFLTFAEDAELTVGVQAKIGDLLTRADVAIIVYASYCNMSIF